MKSVETVDLGFGGMKLLQDRRFLCFSEDTARLAEFAAAHTIQANRICELGSGNGGLSLVLWARTKVSVVGVEVMPSNVDLARRSLALNSDMAGLCEQVRFECLDWRDWEQKFAAGEFDLVVSNPPFWSPEEGRLSPVLERRAATHEIFGGLSDMLRAASGLLKVGGGLCVLLPSERDSELAKLLYEYGFSEREREYFAQRVMVFAEKC